MSPTQRAAELLEELCSSDLMPPEYMREGRAVARALRKPGAADRLAAALWDLMAAEGGEPGPEPAQRAAWRRAQSALKAYERAK